MLSFDFRLIYAWVLSLVIGVLCILITTAVFLLQDLVGHLDELIVYILFYSWIRMAEIVQNPFDGHKHYDIDVMRAIDTELYGATAALHFDQVPKSA